jgi:hypothetical protein
MKFLLGAVASVAGFLLVTDTGGHGKNGAQRMVAGRERRRGECQNAVGFALARKRRLDLVTVRAVAERRPPECSGVQERREANR